MTAIFFDQQTKHERREEKLNGFNWCSDEINLAKPNFKLNPTCTKNDFFQILTAKFNYPTGIYIHFARFNLAFTRNLAQEREHHRAYTRDISS